MATKTILDFTFFSLEPKHNASSRWQRWITRLDNYMVATGIDDDAQQKALLLHFCGEELHSIFETLTLSGATTDSNYKRAKITLTEYFMPNKNVEFEVYTFRKSTQKPSESIDEYYACLKLLAANLLMSIKK